MSNTRFRWWFIPLGLLAAPLIIAIFVFVGGGIVMLLWNWLLPPIFGWPQITLPQGFGLLVLCRILFGGLGRGGGRERHMSDEDRQAFRRRMRERFCRLPADGQESSAG
jgi:hypothetical protein